MRFHMTSAIYHLFNSLQFLGLRWYGSSGGTCVRIVTAELAFDKGVTVAIGWIFWSSVYSIKVKQMRLLIGGGKC